MQMHMHNDLTAREQEILGLVATGKRNKQIAEILGIERYTVEAHLKNIFRKLQVQTRTEAAQWYWQQTRLPAVD